MAADQPNEPSQPTHSSHPSHPKRVWMAADFIASDSSLLVYRRFAVLSARRLSVMQLDLSRLERHWKLLDGQCRSRSNSDNREDSDLEDGLHDLLADIDEKLEKYRITPPALLSPPAL
jgi:hypothetical protein